MARGGLVFSLTRFFVGMCAEGVELIFYFSCNNVATDGSLLFFINMEISPERLLITHALDTASSSLQVHEVKTDCSAWTSVLFSLDICFV